MAPILGLILTLSLILRGAFVTSVPPELFGDEIDVGYQAYSLLKTGRDLKNTPLPIYLNSLAEARAPLLMYATVPAIALWGNSTLAVRLPEILMGSLTPLILFFLAKQSTKLSSYTLPLSCSLALALMPWHIHYSRAAFEVVLLIDLIMLGSIFFLKKRFHLAALFFALSLYAYSTAILFVPLWLMSLAFLNKKIPPLKSLILLVILTLPLACQILLGPARGRFQTISLATDQDELKQTFLLRSLDPNPTSRFFFNKYETYLRLFLTNYLHSFSTDFLFIRGDPSPRQSVQITGELLLLSFPALVVGLYVLVCKSNYFWLIWLLLAPIPASLTVGGGFHATRLFLLVPPVAVILGSGLHFLWVAKRKSTIIYLCLIGLQFVGFSYYYIVSYPKLSWQWWHVGYKDSMQSLSVLLPLYSRVFINNSYEPSLVRFLFWTNYSPAKFQAQALVDQQQLNIFPNYHGFSLENKYVFGTFSDQAHTNGINNYLEQNSLYLISQRDDVGGDWDWRVSPPGNVSVLSTAVDPYDRPLFYLISRK